MRNPAQRLSRFGFDVLALVIALTLSAAPSGAPPLSGQAPAAAGPDRFLDGAPDKDGSVRLAVFNPEVFNIRALATLRTNGVLNIPDLTVISTMSGRPAISPKAASTRPKTAWIGSNSTSSRPRSPSRPCGVRVDRLFALIFVLGAMLAAVAGALLGPLLAVEIGMGENILILALVVIVIGGIGSIRGALVGALLVGMVDTIGRAFLPMLFGLVLPRQFASAAGPSIASVRSTC